MMTTKQYRPVASRSAAGMRDTGQASSHVLAYQNLGGASIPVYVGSTIVGRVVGDVFSKTARASAHQLRTPRAWCWDVSSLDAAERAGAKFAEIKDTESGRTWRASIATIRARGFPVRRGHGDQVGLCLADFTDDRQPAAAQLAFNFGGA